MKNKTGFLLVSLIVVAISLLSGIAWQVRREFWLQVYYFFGLTLPEIIAGTVIAFPVATLSLIAFILIAICYFVRMRR